MLAIVDARPDGRQLQPRPHRRPATRRASAAGRRLGCFADRDAGLMFAEADVTSGGLDSMFSGTDLAMSRMTGWLRRLVWIDLIGGIFLPVGMAGADSGPLAWLPGLACWAIKARSVHPCAVRDSGACWADPTP